MYNCDFPGCNNYSDVDVYFDDGRDVSVCSSHVSTIHPEKIIVQVVPQHGGDNVNQPREL